MELQNPPRVPRRNYTVDQAAHAENDRAFLHWATNPQDFWALIDHGTLPPVADFVEGTVVLAGDILYQQVNGAWEALAYADTVAADIAAAIAANTTSYVSIAKWVTGNG
jgi:hypothetical protein